MTRVIIIFYKQIEKVSEYFFGWDSGWIDVSPSKLRGEIQSVSSQTKSQVFTTGLKLFQLNVRVLYPMRRELEVFTYGPKYITLKVLSA